MLRSTTRCQRQAGWAQLAANLFPLVGVTLLGWSFAEILLVFFFETGLFVLVAPTQFAFTGVALFVAKVVGWYVCWCGIFWVYGVLGLGVCTVVEMERFRGVKDSFEAAFNLIMTGYIDRAPSLQVRAAYAKQAIAEKLIEHKQYITKHGDDMPEIQEWRWGSEGTGAGPARRDTAADF